MSTGVVDLRARPPIGPFLELSLFDPGGGLADRLVARGYQPPPSFLQRSLDLYFDELSASGIDGVIVGARAPGRLGGVSNEAAASVVRAHPERVLGFVGVLSGTAREIDREIAECRELGAIAVAIEPGLWQPARYADADDLHPIYERIEAAGFVAFVTGGDSGPDTSYASPLPIERASAAFPNLQFVAVHGGWPYVGEMISVALRRPNVWVMPDLYAAKFAGHRDYVEAANGVLRDRTLFATSYPAVAPDQYIAALREDGLSEAAWQALAIDNPRRLLGGLLPATAT